MQRKCGICGHLGHTRRTCSEQPAADAISWDIVMQQGAQIARQGADIEFLMGETEMLTMENTMLWAWLAIAAGLPPENPPHKRTLASFSTSEA